MKKANRFFGEIRAAPATVRFRSARPQGSRRLLFEIQLASPYPNDNQALAAQTKREIESGYLPPLKNGIADFASYDTVFIGSPVWYGTMPPPVSSFLASHELLGEDDSAVLHLLREPSG